jgi:hypothetical protein
MKKIASLLLITGTGLFLLFHDMLWASESQPASQPLPSSGSSGAISGSIGYPSDAIPPLWIVAFQKDDLKKYQKVETSPNQATFVIQNLAPGSYVVVAYPKSNDPLRGGYSKAVPCGLLASCSDHSLIPVPVEAGKTSKGVQVTDWYAPENAFPPKPINP